jgi:hypothetical protein
MNANDFQRDLYQRAVYKATFGKPKKHRSVERWPALDYLTIAFIVLRLTGHIVADKLHGTVLRDGSA